MALSLMIAVSAAICLSLAYWCYVPLPEGSEMGTYYWMAFSQFLSIPGALFGLIAGKRQRFELSLSISRGLMSLSKSEPHELIEDVEFDGVSVRVYGRVSESGETYPAIVYFPPSGWVAGNIDMVDSLLRNLWRDTRVVIVAVDYRLAPEHPFPAAFNDGCRAAVHLLNHAADYHVDPRKISVAGDSSGGNIAASVAIWWRNEKQTPPLSHQLLNNPAVQPFDFNTPSYREAANFPFFAGLGSRRSVCAMWLSYILGNWTDQDIDDVLDNKHVDPMTWDRYASYYSSKHDATPYQAREINHKLAERMRDKITSPYVAPLAAENLKNLPTTLIIYPQLDVLRTDAELYARRLERDGVNVTRISQKLSYHGDSVFGFEGAGIFQTASGVSTLRQLKDYINSNL